MKTVRISSVYFLMLQEIAKKRKIKVDKAIEEIIDQIYKGKWLKLIRFIIQFVLIMKSIIGQLDYTEIH